MTRILFLSHSHVIGPFRVGSHHYAHHLAAAGVEVVHLSTPLSAAHRVTGRVSRGDAALLPRGVFRDAAGATHVVPRTLLPVPLGRFRVARELRRHGLDTAFDAVLIDQPLLWDESVRALSPRLVYRPTDLYPEGLKRRLQERIIAAADGVVATSAEVLRDLGRVAVPTLVLPNGVDAERFEGGPRSSRPAVCIYVGALDDRFDGGQLVAWAQAHPDVVFRVAGPGAAAGLPGAGMPGGGLPGNIELLGAVPYDTLPALLHGARVGLLPLSDSPLNAGRSPMKLHEYLAAGLAVVTRATPVIGDDQSCGVFAYTGPADAEGALVRALAHPSPNDAGTRRAADESWTAKAASLQDFLAALGNGG